ncbi:MAG: hypothetical protein ACKO7D_10755 [Bacteroidota bacterium]
MKKLTYFGVIFSIIVTFLAVYLQFVVVENAAVAESIIFSNHVESWYNSSEHLSALEDLNLKTNLGIVVFFSGILGILICIIPAIKKYNIAWVGVALSLISFLIGAIQGTHMFS